MRLVIVNASLPLTRRSRNISFLNDAHRVCQMGYEPTIGESFSLFGLKPPSYAPLQRTYYAPA